VVSFPSPLSSPQKATARTSGYWARVLACLNDNAVVFQAQASESITDAPFITFSWDNATVGAFGDVWEGMTCFISSTTDIRDFKYRGRVRLAPSATHFFIDENATVLNDNDYITVIRDVEMNARIRRDTLVDSSIAYRDLPPTTTDLPMAIVLYDSDDDGQVTYTTIQDGVPVDADATTVDIWAWDVSGGGTSSIDDPTLQNPTFTFEAGYHYLIRAIFEDDNGTENYQISHVYAVNRTLTAPVVQAVVAGSIQGSLDDGWTASLTAYADVSTMLDRTHVAVWSIEHFGDNSSDPFVSNVLMNGRIRSDSIQTEGSAEAGRIQQVTFSVEGLTAYLRRLRIPNDIIRPDATPAQWGEIKEPNPWRMTVYALWVYTTLTNICSVSVEDGAFADWQIGGQPRGIDGGFTLDVLNSILETIHAAPNYSPSGEIHFAQTVSYKDDRSGVQTIMAFELQDTREYNVDRDSSNTVAQSIAFGGVFNSVSNVVVLYTAQAPSIVYGDGADTRELTREILVADSTAVEASAEIGLRASNDFAFNNPKPLASLSLFDSYAGLMIPTNFQRWANIFPASSNTRGIAYTSTDYFQLQSVSLTINANGTIDVSPEMYGETSFDDAQVLAALLPNNLSNMNPVLPVLPNDPAFPTDPLENYPTDDPGLDDLQPIDPDSAAQAYTPFPPDAAAAAAAKQGKAGCKVLQLLFSNGSNTTSSWTTVLNDPYLLTITGSTQISTGFETCSNLAINDGGWTASDAGGNPNPNFGFYDAGVGLAPHSPDKAFYFIREATPGLSITSITFTFNETVTDFRFGRQGGAAIDYAGAATLTVTFDETTDPLFFPFSLALESYITTSTNLAVTTTFRVTDVCVESSGSPDPLYADAFYQWNIGADDTPEAGEVINKAALGPSQGLFLDNSLFTPSSGIPPFSPSHQYIDQPFLGTGNVLLARMVFSGFTTAQRLYLTLEMCKVVSA
jgi:hypothetical protein